MMKFDAAVWSGLIFRSVLLMALGGISHNLFAAAPSEVIVIQLRTPNNNQDARFDPYYDLGADSCFGVTGCHRSNVMNPQRSTS